MDKTTLLKQLSYVRPGDIYEIDYFTFKRVDRVIYFLYCKGDIIEDGDAETIADAYIRIISYWRD